MLEEPKVEGLTIFEADVWGSPIFVESCSWQWDELEKDLSDMEADPNEGFKVDMRLRRE
jgi:hypothetical protein